MKNVPSGKTFVDASGDVRTQAGSALKSQGSSSRHSKQSDTISAGKSLVRQSKSELILHAKDGRIQEARSVTKETPKSAPASSLALRMGDRLRRARLMAGFSLRGLSDAIHGGVSHTMIQKFEAGEICPDSKLLARLGQVLQVSADYFFKTDQMKLETVEYRSQTKLGTKARQRLEEHAYEFFERYLEIETILGLPAPAFPQADLSKVQPEELADAIEEAATGLRETWELGMNPIPNVHATLEKHGVKVRILPHEEGFDGFSAFAKSGTQRVPVTALSEHWLRGTDADLPRFRFTALHELAHLYLILPDEMPPKDKEKCCHRFSGAFLIPRKSFEGAFGVNRVKIALAELCAIKAEWGMSVAAIMKRASNLGLISEGRYKTFCIVSATNGWRTKDPGKWIGDEESHRFKPLVLRALAQELITTSKAASLLKISLPDLGEAYKPFE